MSSFQVGPETFLTLQYQVFDAEGESVGDKEVIGCVFGMGQLLPAIESSLDGKMGGERVRVRLEEREAFGPRHEKAILEVDRAEFPPDVAAGDRFEAENEQGGLLVLQILDVQDEVVVVDTNHPLAGQAVEVELFLLEVRPASQAELEAAVVSLEEDENSLATEKIRGAPVIAPEALLRGR